MAHFVACNKNNDASNVADLYFKEIVHLHDIPKTILLDQDSKFLSYFWNMLWRKAGMKLMFSTSHHPKTNRQTKLHEQIHNRIEAINTTFKQKSNKNKRPQIFADGDLVWLHLRKECFPTKRKNKLMPRAKGPYKVVG